MPKNIPGLVLLRVSAFERALAQKGFTIMDLAVKSGVHPNYLRGLRFNTRNPSGPTRLKIQEALGVSFEDIFFIADPEQLWACWECRAQVVARVKPERCSECGCRRLFAVEP